MKLTLFSIVCDLHNNGQETCLYTSLEEYNAAIQSFMEERLNEFREPNRDEATAIQQCRELIAASKLDEAWEVFNDYECELKHPDDYIYFDTHTLDVPLAPELLHAALRCTRFYDLLESKCPEMTGLLSGLEALSKAIQPPVIIVPAATAPTCATLATLT